MSTQRILNGSINLAKLQSAISTTAKGNKVLIIPIDSNYLTEKNGAVYMNCNIIVRDEQDQYGQNGFIAQKLDSETYKSLGKEKANEIKLPILGNIKDFASEQPTATIAEVIGDNDDLEFNDLGF